MPDLPLSNRAYAATTGARCPYCYSEEVESTSSLDHDGEVIMQGARCVTCGKEWTDFYTLTYYEPVEDDNPFRKDDA